jgi:hypothetical protein
MSNSPYAEPLGDLIHKSASLCMNVSGFKDQLFEETDYDLETRRHLGRVEDDIFNALAHLRSLYGTLERQSIQTSTKGDKDND